MESNTRCYALILLCIQWCLVFSGGDPVQIQRRDGEIRQDTVVYKTLSGGYKLHAMVHFPREWRPTDKRPVFVCSYGSGWRGGKYAADPRNDKYLSRWEPKCDDMAMAGMVCVRYDYRLSSKSEGFPKSVFAMISDARSIIRWIRQNAGGLGVDTGRICGAGGSSGFHIMVSGTVFNSTEYNQPGEESDISPKAHALIGFTGALCNSRPDGRIKGICPRDSIKAGGPAFLGIVGEKDGWRGGVELFAEKAYKHHMPAQIKSYPNGNHDFHAGIFGRGSKDGYHTSMGWAQAFLFSIGHMDLTVECRPGDNVNLKTLSEQIRGFCEIVDTLGPCGDIQYSHDGSGGKVSAAGVFTSNGRPGMYRVTARPGGHPHIARSAVIRVPVMLEASTGSPLSVPAGFTGIYAKIKAGSGEEAVFTVKGRDGDSAITFSTKSLSEGYYYIGSFPSDGHSPGSMEVSGNGGGNIDSLMLVRAYTGNWAQVKASVPPSPQFKILPGAEGDGREVDFFSLSGKRLNDLSTHRPGKENWIFITRNKQNGRVKLGVQLP